MTYVVEEEFYTKLSIGKISRQIADSSITHLLTSDVAQQARMIPMVTGKFSIPTEYNGQAFRSKLEADWARAFDTLGVQWRYEPKGRYFGDVFYLVDFYLPMSRQWVEVKGVFEPEDCRKIVGLLTHIEARPYTDPETCPDIALVACEPKGVFRGWERGCARPTPVCSNCRSARVITSDCSRA
jgi:hypothetical protein